MTKLSIRRPDDWHLHLRDGDALGAVVGPTARVFARALVMPNLKPPVRTVDDALAYRDRILAAAPEGSGFLPLMTLYLTDRTTPADIRAAAASPHVVAAKLYPAGATTNSDLGVTDIGALDPVLAAMADSGMVLCVHGEVTHGQVDVFDREAVFLRDVLDGIVARHPALRVVLEHITTSQGVDFVAAHDQVGGTVTAHHLLLNRNALFEGGIRPHRYCLPILKRESHRQALVQAAVAHPRIFLGTDSAPHARHTKESACGCAGMYTACHALPLYAEVFEDAGALDALQAFASERGPAFYGLPPNEERVTLCRSEDVIPGELPFGDHVIVPFRAGGTVRWRVTTPR